MFNNNPFSNLAEIVSPLAMQGFVIAMILLVVLGTLIDIIHKKNVKYFFDNAKKAKKNAQVELSTAKRTSVILKTVAHDIATTAELGRGKRRVAHVMGMYGTIIFWACSAILIFSYSSVGIETPSSITTLWHAGAILTCLGGYWFWFFLRVDVLAEAHPWYRTIKAEFEVFGGFKIHISLFEDGENNWIKISGIHNKNKILSKDKGDEITNWISVIDELNNKSKDWVYQFPGYEVAGLKQCMKDLVSDNEE